MYKLFSILILILFNTIPITAQSTQNKIIDEEAIKTELAKIAIDNLRSWEPPFYEEKMLKPFFATKDLLVVIDGIPIRGFVVWKSIVYNSMKADRESNFKKYRHIIKDIRTSILTENSGVVTVMYGWDYITKEDRHYSVNAAVTLVFKLEKNEWKIIQFHCSHGKKKLISENN